MKEIHLTQGKVAIVDDADYEWLNQWKWRASKDHNTYYAVRSVWAKPSIIMHRLILGLIGNEVVDHMDHDGLNNQRNNLRPCTRKQNQQNMRSHLNSTSKYLGVCVNKHRNRYTVQITGNGKKVFVGHFISEVDAALAYNKAAQKYHGEFANLNVV